MNDLGSAINQVIKNYDNVKPSTLDFGHFATACSEELKSIGIPYYKMYLDEHTPDCLVIEMPVFESCTVRLEDGYCILCVDGKDVRKIKLANTTSEYGKALANAMMDYFKRLLMFKLDK